MMKYIMVVAVLLVLTSQECCYARSRVDKPLVLIDENGIEIDDYCVAPLYSRSTGISFSPESEGGNWDGNGYLMWPVAKKAGDSFYDTIKNKRSHQFMWISFGESITPSVPLYLRAGRSPLVGDFYLSFEKTKTNLFPAGDSNYAIDLLTADQLDEDAIRSLYKVGKHWRIVSRYTKEEKALLKSCYERK